MTGEALAAGVELEGIEVRRQTLEDVYLELVREEGLMRIFLHEVRNQQRLFWRSRESAFFTFLLPILLLVLLGSVYGDDEIDGIPGADYLVAGLIGYGVVAVAFAGLAINVGDPA